MPKRVNDKADYRNGDAGIGDIEGRPGICVANVQIKKEKINHMPIEKAIGEIAEDASKQKRERHIAPDIA